MPVSPHHSEDILKNRPIKILALGYYGARNIGDELLLANLISWSHEQHAEVTALSFDPACTKDIHHIDAVSWNDLDDIVRRMKESDLFVIGGGGIFQDRDSLNSKDLEIFPAKGVTLYAQLFFLARQLGLPTLLLAQGIGPIATSDASHIVRDVFSQATDISLRDEPSKLFLEKLGLNRPIIIAPDPIWHHSLRHNRDIPFLKELSSSKKTLALMMRNWPNEGDWEDAFVQSLNQYASEDWEFLWIPFQPSLRSTPTSDIAMIDHLIEKLGSNHKHIIYKYPVIEDVEAVLARCDAAIAMRLHGLILALKAGLPTIALEYDRKVSEAATMAELKNEQRVSFFDPPEKITFAIRTLLDEKTRGDFLPSRERIKHLGQEALIHKNLLTNMISSYASEGKKNDTESAHSPDWLSLWGTHRPSKISLFQATIKGILRSRLYAFNKFLYNVNMFFEMVALQGLSGAFRKVYQKIFKTKSSCLRVNPYHQISLLKDIPVEVISRFTPAIYSESLPYSCITTIKNEEKTIETFLRSIEQLTLPPSELIIIDGGSTDRTSEIVQDAIGQLPFKVVYHEAGPINIAEGRNIGLHKASNEVVLFVDAGCLFGPDFALQMVGPMFSPEGEVSDAVDLVGGIYTPIYMNRYVFKLIHDWKTYTDWNGYLPSARAICAKRSLCLSIGGFPEYLNLTGEDTLFDVLYRRVSQKWIINKAASVQWNNPDTATAAQKLEYRYGFGSGQSGVGDFYLYDQLAEYLKGRSIDDFNSSSPRVSGYLKGRLEKPKMEIEKRSVKNISLIFSDVPLSHSENIQLVTDLTNKHHKVLFIFAGDYGDTTTKIFLDVDYTLLECYDVNDFSVADFGGRYGGYSDIHLSLINKSAHPKAQEIIENLQKRLG
ncbi:MAG: polysaccharide pyruvyl transferase family protein [Candidatus Gracilibacteria bacterium]